MNQALRDKNILITGGAGFIGCALSNKLAAESCRLVIVDNLLSQVHPSQTRPKQLNESAQLVIADVAEKSTWSDLLKDFHPDIVVHLAAETSTGQSLRQASQHTRTNLLGLTELLDTFALENILPEHIVLTSSRAVYGEGSWMAPDGNTFYPGQRSNAQLSLGKWDFDGIPLPSVCGQTKENPTSVYGATKLAQEHLLRSWALSFGVSLSILRLQNVYGPGQSPFNPYTGIVILFSRLAKTKRPIELYEDGLVTRDFVFIDDILDALVKTVLNKPANASRLLDIGSGVRTTLIDLASLITNFHSAPAAIVCGKYRNGDVRHASCNIDATKQELGWEPKWDLASGIAALQEYELQTNLQALKPG